MPTPLLHNPVPLKTSPCDAAERNMAHVLLVDDDDLVRMVTAELLRDLGYVVSEAASGSEALEIFQTTQIDVLVTDIRMAGALNGWQTAEAARVLRDGLPIIYISGFSVRPIRSVPDAVYLHKPFTAAELGKAIQTVFPR